MAGPGAPVQTWTVRSIVGTMFPLLIVLSLVVILGSGFVLQELEETYLTNPVLLMLVPVMINLGGNLGAILSSRLSTRLHLGILSFDPRNEVLRTNVIAVLALAGTIFAVLGAVAYGFGYLLRAPMPLGTTLTISLVSGIVLTVLVIVVSIVTTYVSYRLGLDPDDTTIPVVTNVCDVLGVLILTAVAIAVL